MINSSIISAKSFLIIILIITGLFIPITPIKINAASQIPSSKVFNLNNFDGGFLSPGSIGQASAESDYGFEGQLYSDSIQTVPSTENQLNINELPLFHSPSSSPSSPSSSPAATPKSETKNIQLPFDTDSISPLLPFNVEKVIDGFTSPSSSDINTDKIIPNQYIVVLDKNDDINPSSIISKLASQIDLADSKILQVYQYALNGFAIWAPNEKIIQMLEKIPGVDHIEKDVIVQAASQTLPTGIDRIDADLSSTKSGDGTGNVDVDIAIIDTGIDLKHSDLNVYNQKNFVTSTWSSLFGSTTANDDNGHGSHVAGIAAAKDNSIGVAGVAPGARLWAVKVLGSDGTGPLSTIIKGIDYVTQNAKQIEVANMSLGCECTSSAFDTAINNSVKSGITYVVAAGNGGKDAAKTQPANNPNVITVSAIADSDGKCGGVGPSTSYGNDDTLASFSNYGSVIDMAAPGVKILSTYKGNAYATMSGTSMASPYVAGAAALYKSNHPTASPTEVLNALKSSGSTQSTNCDGKGNGYFSGDKDSYNEPLLYVKNY